VVGGIRDHRRNNRAQRPTSAQRMTTAQTTWRAPSSGRPSHCSISRMLHLTPDPRGPREAGYPRPGVSRPKSRASRERIDRLLVARGLTPTRTRAQSLVMAGKVVVDGHRVDKAGTMVRSDADIRLRGEDHPYVSRGGLKLEGALRAFGAAERSPRLEVQGRVAMDVGASTGGFTDCLLRHGVARVHAVDVGYGQLAWTLASDARVRVHDRRNIRTMPSDEIGESIDLVVVDCSFIAAAKVLPHLPAFLAATSDVVVLVKPQFELDPTRISKGGIVRDADARADAVQSVRATALALGFEVVDHVVSPIKGREGNEEYLLWLRWKVDRPPTEAPS
jgi:23S rRNA (cytidine1920-2'-O)/16S rRNA (cytidine1409-2'-O)-methyltransferase